MFLRTQAPTESKHCISAGGSGVDKGPAGGAAPPAVARGTGKGPAVRTGTATSRVTTAGSSRWSVLIDRGSGHAQARHQVGVDSVDLAKASDDDDAVRVGTMHRVKGLEFRCVCVAGVSAKHVPAANAVTPAEDDKQTHQQDLERERCLLFVACTRAREELLVTWHGEPSPFVASVVQD